MLVLKRTYTDYNGDKRTEDFHFYLSKAELLEMQLGVDGGLENKVRRIQESRNVPEIISLFKEIVLKSYGEVSLDGRRFIKNDEIRDAFAQTEAYSDLFFELATDAEAAAKFINGIIPASLADDMNNKSEISTIETV